MFNRRTETMPRPDAMEATTVYGRPGRVVGTKMWFGGGVEVPVGRTAVETVAVTTTGDGVVVSAELLGVGTVVATTAAAIGAAVATPTGFTAVGASGVGGSIGRSVAVEDGEGRLAGELVLTGNPMREGD
jgi:hypothetical protein